MAQCSLFYHCQLDQYVISKCLASYFWKAIDQEAAVTGHFALREAASYLWYLAYLGQMLEKGGRFVV